MPLLENQEVPDVGVTVQELPPSSLSDGARDDEGEGDQNEADESQEEREKEASEVSLVVSGMKLGLPSDLDIDERRRICSEDSLLVAVEISLRHAEASESLESVRSAVRSLNRLERESTVKLRGQGLQTRSTKLRDTRMRDKLFHIAIYNRARDCLQALGVLDDPEMAGYYPRLVPEDASRINPARRREPGSSKFTDGRVWHPLVPPSLPRGNPISDAARSLNPSSSSTRRNTSEASSAVLDYD